MGSAVLYEAHLVILGPRLFDGLGLKHLPVVGGGWVVGGARWHKELLAG